MHDARDAGGGGIGGGGGGGGGGVDVDAKKEKKRLLAMLISRAVVAFWTSAVAELTQNSLRWVKINHQ